MAAARRILVVFYSSSGNTERVAQDLAARLSALDSVRERSSQLDEISTFHQKVAAFVETLHSERSAPVAAHASG